MNEDAEHFHEFGRVANIVHIQTEHGHKFVQRPRVHQFIKAGKIHRAKEKRPVGQFELFLDLVMVGVVHQLADLASETEDGMAVARFVLTFWGAWSIWADYRNYVNTCATDDFPQRVYTFCMVAILIGYSANSTGVEIEHNKYIENDSTKASMRGAVGFLLVAKCIRFVLHVFYALYLPEFFLDQMVLAAWMLVAAALYLGALFAPHIQTGTILFGCAGIVENLQQFFGVMLYRFVTKMQQQLCSETPTGWFKKRIKDANIAVFNIEHAADRNGAFYTIVLGESVTNLLYQVASFPHSAGVSVYYGRAFCILLVSFNLNWLYFTEDWTVEKIHPVRRHWSTAIVYQFVHWPLTAGLIISSAAVAQLVHPSSVEEADSRAGRYYWGGGMAVALFCLAILDVLPKWDFWTWDRALVQFTRFVFRLICVAICACLPLAGPDRLTNLGFVGCYAGVFVFLVAEELLGKMLIMSRTRKYADKEACFRHDQEAREQKVVDDLSEGSTPEPAAAPPHAAAIDTVPAAAVPQNSTRPRRSPRRPSPLRSQRSGSVSSVSSLESFSGRDFSRSDEKSSGTDPALDEEAAGPVGPYEA